MRLDCIMGDELTLSIQLRVMMELLAGVQYEGYIDDQCDQEDRHQTALQISQKTAFIPIRGCTNSSSSGHFDCKLITMDAYPITVTGEEWHIFPSTGYGGMFFGHSYQNYSSNSMHSVYHMEGICAGNMWCMAYELLIHQLTQWMHLGDYQNGMYCTCFVYTWIQKGFLTDCTLTSYIYGDSHNPRKLASLNYN